MLNLIPLKEISAFIIGFAISSLIVFNLSYNYDFWGDNYNLKIIKHHLSLKTTQNSSKKIFECDLAEKLFNEVRILCMVHTYPQHHDKNVVIIENTWGKRCNKLLFMSSKTDPNHPNIVNLNISEGRENLWLKTRLSMNYVYEHHFDDADWFLRADDDNFLIIENLRYKLYQYNPKTSIYIGHRYAIQNMEVNEGYMAGGGNIFSKKALEKFVKISMNNTLCNIRPGEAEDVMSGRCMKNHALFIDARDSSDQKQMFPIGTDTHMEYKDPDFSYWYWKNLYRNVTQGGLGCCSDIFIEAHYVHLKEFYLMDYLIYNVYPFGVKKNVTEVLPRKLTLEEVIKKSDEKSYSPNFIPHKIVHYIDEDEKY